MKFIKQIWSQLFRLYEALFYSFDSKQDTGFDPRKLTAWAIIGLAGYSHVKYVDQTVIEDVLIIDYSFVCLLLGLVTYQDLIKLKKNEKPTTDSNTGTPV